MHSASSYQEVPSSGLQSGLTRHAQALWDIEREADLLFRKDFGVYLWASNRIKYYYQVADKIGTYDKTGQRRLSATEIEERRLAFSLAELRPAEVFVFSSATFKSVANRKRPYGCVYTNDFVRLLLEAGRSVLVVSNAPDQLVEHPHLQCITTDDIQALIRECSRGFKIPLEVSKPQQAYWQQVEQRFRERLSCDLTIASRLMNEANAWLRNYRMYKSLFSRCQTKLVMMVAHYGRGPMIQAARDEGAFTAEYQHSLTSKYHNGYSFAHVRPEARNVPYLPDEFWSWGPYWTENDWFPAQFFKPRVVGHYSLGGPATPEARTDEIVLIASWPFQTEITAIVRRLIALLPLRRIIIKCHPFEDEARYIREFGNEATVSIVAGDVDIVNVLRSAELAIGISSTSVYEAVKLGCKTIIVNTTSIEYLEEFIQRFHVPVLEPDCSNLEPCMEQVERQNIDGSQIIVDTNQELRWAALEAALAGR